MGQEGATSNIEMITDAGEQAVREELKRCQVQAEIIAMQRYSDAEKAKFSKIIREFNELYHKLHQQTWCNTKWRGVPVCKAPTDMWIYQELIQAIQPDLIIETGTLCGGSALYMRDIMKLSNIYGWVISVDIQTENLNDLAKVDGIKFLRGSSVDQETLTFMKAHIAAYDAKKIMIVLDSNHEKEHVLKELELYAPLVSVGSALIVEDTNNHPGPKAAADDWYCDQPGGYEFRKDFMCEKFMLTFNRDGYYERVK